MSMRSQTAIRRLCAAGAALCITLCAGWAAATTLLKLDMPELVEQSEQIVHGSVTEITPRRADGRIYTYITLEAREHLKGEPAETVTFRVLGGRMGDLATIVHGTPDFSLGEEVVVFLERPRQGAELVVAGMIQGKFQVATGPDQRTLYVVPQLGGAPLVEPIELRDEEGNLRRRLRAAQPSELHGQVSALETFKRRVREQVEAP